MGGQDGLIEAVKEAEKDTGVLGRLTLAGDEEEEEEKGKRTFLSYILGGGGPIDIEEGNDPPSNLGPLPLEEEFETGSL